MFLKTVRVIQWVIGALLIVYGIYLIFGVQEFFGTLAIIAAFFIFPSLDKGNKTAKTHDDNKDPYHASTLDSEASSVADSGGDSGGNSGD